MIGTVISHYRILQTLGQGGMGVVYKAEDLRLKRTVALKFLPERLSGHSEVEERFEQEAQAASSLNHPNIATIYEIDQAGGQIFIAMEFIDGVTLREWNRVKEAERNSLHRPLNKETVDVAVQIAEALCAAHDKGIVHRDVKSDNIMVTPEGRAKLMDFGLAKLRGVSTLTKLGSTIGTVAYMSPEQAEGLEADHRTDIYSFGVILYEMLTGQLPFRAPHEAGLIYEIMNVEPIAPSEAKQGIDGELDRIVMKCLEKDREVRYQSMRDVLVDLKRYRRDSEGKRIERRPVPVAAELQTVTPPPATDKPPSPSHTTPHHRLQALVVAGIVVLVAAAAYFLFFRPKPMNSIAVLPFINMERDSSQEYLSDGLTENIINNLTKISRLRVVPRSTVFHYKGKDVDPTTVGRELGVQTVLVGRIRQRGDDLTIQTELIDVGEDAQLWGEQYSGKLADAQGLQETISRQITDKLRVRLTSEERELMAKHSTENPEAYQLYLKGRFYWNKRRADYLETAIEFFHEAIDKDPNYALAYAGLAAGYAVLPEYGHRQTSEFVPKAESAAQRALELDPNLAEAYAVLGLVKEYQWDWTGAEARFKQALAINPSYPSTHHWYSILLRVQGKLDESRAEIARAQELDPLSAIISLNVGITYYYQRQYERAVEEFKKVLAMEPDFSTAHANLGTAYITMGKLKEALAEVQKMRDVARATPTGLGLLAYLHAQVGNRKEARAALDELFGYAKQGYAVAREIALAYLGLGDRDLAFEWLNKAIQGQEATVYYVAQEPIWDPLRGDPRFHELMRRIGLGQ